MLQEVKDLQNKAVTELYRKAHSDKKKLTFRAPTGSGKTRMMADFMNRILEEQPDVVFIVSTLSKGGLPKQNYDTFRDCAVSGYFPKLKPYLISTDLSGEEDLFIPLDYNVYVLPRDLYKEGGLLKRGAFDNFLKTMTYKYFDEGRGKRIYLIRDECHQATNNLDEKDAYFERTFNFSATPAKPYDVEITDKEAEDVKLIKHVINEEDSSFTVDDALDSLLDIREQYINLLGVRPCLIIQISNASKAEDEYNKKILPALNRRQSIKWMSIVNTCKKEGGEDKSKEKLFDTNDAVKKRLPPSKWKDYAKQNDSTIDVIIFKMVITEGWDIPRACMLYQVRKTQSETLDEQVMGRVRRNPRLMDFEKLSPAAQKLASTAWVWGVLPKDTPSSISVRLWKIGNNDVKEQFRISTTRLETLQEKEGFDVEDFVSSHPKERSTDIFTLYRKLQRGENNLSVLCFKYSAENVQRWWDCMEVYDILKRSYDTFIRNYSESMVYDKETSFPEESLYLKSNNQKDIEDWLWENKDNTNRFSFDSEAECEWANFLAENADDFCACIETTTNEECYLWGKNFPYQSEVHYEYYDDGKHKSYPDFVMKDKHGRMHVFEVKSLEGNGNADFDIEEYKKKIEKLKDCYLHCSLKLPDYFFYIPIKENGLWNITRYFNGKVSTFTKKELRRELKK
jgi:type III restriction enzyme